MVAPESVRAAPAERLAWAVARLGASGHRDTRPRRLLLDVLAGADGHLTVEAIHRRASRAGRLDLSTVYRTLAIFEGLRLVHTLNVGGRTTYGLADHPHAHAVCDRCSRVTALREEEWDRAAEALRGFTCTGIVVRGHCDECRDAP